MEDDWRDRAWAERRALLIKAILATATDMRYTSRKTPDTDVRMRIRRSVLEVLTDRDVQTLEEKYHVILERRTDGE